MFPFLDKDNLLCLPVAVDIKEKIYNLSVAFFSPKISIWFYYIYLLRLSFFPFIVRVLLFPGCIAALISLFGNSNSYVISGLASFPLWVEIFVILLCQVILYCILDILNCYIVRLWVLSQSIKRMLLFFVLAGWLGSGLKFWPVLCGLWFCWFTFQKALALLFGFVSCVCQSETWA